MQNNDLRFGCEFEFYVNLDREGELIEKLKELSIDESHINMVKDSMINYNHRMNYKMDDSLIYIR